MTEVPQVPASAGYLKAIGPALTALAMTLITAVNVGALDTAALETGLVGLAAAIVSYAVTNTREGIGKYMKAFAPAALTAIGFVVHGLVTGGFGDPADVRIAFAGGLAALVALVLPNVPIATPRTAHPSSN